MELSFYYDFSFWQELILAASIEKPYLRHTVSALGALHEEYSVNKSASLLYMVDSSKSRFALRQYAKAIAGLRTSIADAKEEPVTALMACILFVCFDSVRGWYESAMIHLESGLEILYNIRISSENSHLVENVLAPLLLRLSIQSIIYVEARIPSSRVAFALKLLRVTNTGAPPLESFRDLQEARDSLACAVNCFLGSSLLFE